MKKKNSRESYLSIRQKLIAAVAMLLVATFMVASSSYAWFTLSTAPEVTGIKTSVGANGSLEIALVPATATVANITNDLANITAGVGDSGKYDTWGNLVDLSDEKYGLEDITLYPSLFIVGADGKVAHGGAILGTPVYGADGRVKTVNADAVSGLYDATTEKFQKNTTAMGVTAIGTVSSMSQQQLDWMNAKSKVSTALSLAKTAAENALSENGAALVDLILSNAGGATEYNMAAIGAMLEDLVGDASNKGVVAYIEEAMTYYIVACAATANPDLDDVAFAAMKNAIVADCTDGTFPTISAGKITITGVSGDIDVSATLLDEVYAKYTVINNAISTAQSEYNTATTNGTATTGKAWDDVTAALSPLMDVNEVTINGHAKSEFTTENLGALASDIIADGAVVVDMPKDSGVFADIGEICGNISSTFRCNVNVNVGFTINVPNMAVNMKTSVADGELLLLNNAFPTEPADRQSAAGVTENLTSLYGYSLDFAFRTNAASSNLMLQTTEANRIYSSGGSAETQGHGSSMTFTVVDNKFTATDIQRLMSHIRIVFTDVNGTVLSAAKLDTENAEITGSSVKALIKLCESSVISVDTDGDAGSATVSTLSYGDFKTVNDKGQMELMALSQNTPTVVSVYVYLDETTQGSDVAADAAKSAVGTMNLQFSSDANLVPMDYAEFKDASETTTSAPETTVAP